MRAHTHTAAAHLKRNVSCHFLVSRLALRLETGLDSRVHTALVKRIHCNEVCRNMSKLLCVADCASRIDSNEAYTYALAWDVMLGADLLPNAKTVLNFVEGRLALSKALKSKQLFHYLKKMQQLSSWTILTSRINKDTASSTGIVEEALAAERSALVSSFSCAVRIISKHPRFLVGDFLGSDS